MALEPAEVRSFWLFWICPNRGTLESPLTALLSLSEDTNGLKKECMKEKGALHYHNVWALITICLECRAKSSSARGHTTPSHACWHRLANLLWMRHNESSCRYLGRLSNTEFNFWTILFVYWYVNERIWMSFLSSFLGIWPSDEYSKK